MSRKRSRTIESKPIDFNLEQCLIQASDIPSSTVFLADQSSIIHQIKAQTCLKIADLFRIVENHSANKASQQLLVYPLDRNINDKVTHNNREFQVELSDNETIKVYRLQSLLNMTTQTHGSEKSGQNQQSESEKQLPKFTQKTEIFLKYVKKYFLKEFYGQQSIDGLKLNVMGQYNKYNIEQSLEEQGIGLNSRLIFLKSCQKNCKLEKQDDSEELMQIKQDPVDDNQKFMVSLPELPQQIETLSKIAPNFKKHKTSIKSSFEFVYESEKFLGKKSDKIDNNQLEKHGQIKLKTAIQKKKPNTNKQINSPQKPKKLLTPTKLMKIDNIQISPDKNNTYDKIDQELPAMSIIEPPKIFDDFFDEQIEELEFGESPEDNSNDQDEIKGYDWFDGTKPIDLASRFNNKCQPSMDPKHSFMSNLNIEQLDSSL